MILCERCSEPCKANAKRFCSLSCRDLFRREKQMRPCLACGTSFYRSPKHQSRGQFCSRKCFGSSRTGQNHHNWHGGKIEKNCTECDSVFFVKQSDSDIQKCSVQCHGKYLSRINAHNIPDKCQECGIEIKIVLGKVGKRNFCSRKCSSANHAKHIKGTRNGRFIHGKHQLPYPAGWTRSLRKLIRDRDGNRCVLCHMTQKQHGKYLCVHHIDYDKSNLDHSNLITVCRFCHGKMHGSKQERKIWQTNLSALLRSSLSGVLPSNAQSTTSQPDHTTTTLPMEF